MEVSICVNVMPFTHIHNHSRVLQPSKKLHDIVAKVIHLNTFFF